MNAYYRFYVRINSKLLKNNWNTEKLINELNKKKIVCNFGACPLIYKEKIFVKEGYNLSLNNAMKLSDNVISFMINPNIDSDYIKNFNKNTKLIFKKSELKNVK